MDSKPIMPQLSRSFSKDESDASMPKEMKKFYRGEPLALGITQILIGIIQIGFGVVMHIRMIQARYYESKVYIHLEVPIWTGILFIISGSLSVAAARNPKMPMVKGMLGMNIVSSVAAGLGIIFISISLTSEYYTPWHVRESCNGQPPEKYRECYKTLMLPLNISLGILAVFLVLNILEFCITISNAAFGCKTVCQNNYTETVVVVYQNATPGDAVAFPAACKDPESP